MKRLTIALLIVAGWAIPAGAFDIFRTTGTSQVLNPVASGLSATSIFTGNRVARVFCSASCWVAVSATNVDTKYAISASAILNTADTVFLAVPASHYVLFRRYGSSTMDAVVTPVEDANPHR